MLYNYILYQFQELSKNKKFTLDRLFLLDNSINFAWVKLQFILYLVTHSKLFYSTYLKEDIVALIDRLHDILSHLSKQVDILNYSNQFCDSNKYPYFNLICNSICDSYGMISSLYFIFILGQQK